MSRIIGKQSLSKVVCVIGADKAASKRSISHCNQYLKGRFKRQLIMQIQKFIHSFQFYLLMLAVPFTAAPLLADDALNNTVLSNDYEQLANLLSNSRYFQANFQQTVRDANGDIVDQSTGNIWLARPNQLRWDIVEPLEQTLIVSEQQFFQYDSDIDQLIIEPLSDQLSAMPVLLLSGNADAISNQFIVAQIKAVTAHSANKDAPLRQLFTLKPIANDGLFEMLSLEFKGEILQAISILDDLQQNSRFEFTAIDIETVIDVSLFELDPPADTDIIHR
ncbi:outer membrane lipoprotein chaperone LolA [bacterium]|nr:outer membrane lipoprotein chaperone LolA [bacterium]